MQLEFSWDPRKARANIRKHGVSFNLAVLVFQDRMSLTVFDPDASTLQEDRWVTLGQVRDRRHLVVVHTYHETEGGIVRIRVISARPATRREILQYEQY